MDISIIEEEIDKFNQVFFAEISKTTGKYLDFIDENRLHMPKENYTIVGAFLSTTLKKFRVLDSTFMSSTLKKLDEDVKLLQTLRASTLLRTKNIKEVFELEFVKSSVTLTRFAREIIKIQNLSNPTPEQTKERVEFSAMYKELKSIYYTVFTEIFNDDKKYNLSLLMQALNSKTYYFDKLLWKEASKSNVIKKHFHVLKIDNKLNTKVYLFYTTGLMRPYTKEYKYLQSCLRIYK